MNRLYKRKLVVATLLLSSLVMATSCHNQGEQPQQKQSSEFLSATATIEQEGGDLRTYLRPMGSASPAPFMTYWSQNDRIHTIFQQGDKVRYLDPDLQDKPEGSGVTDPISKLVVTDINSSDPSKANFTFYAPGNSAYPGTLDLTKEMNMYAFASIGSRISRSKEGGYYDKVAIDISPSKYYVVDRSDIFTPSEKVTDREGSVLEIPVRASKSSVNVTSRPALDFQHFGALQIIEVQNHDEHSITNGTIGFTSSDWYYGEGSTFDPTTNRVTSGSVAASLPPTATLNMNAMREEINGKKIVVTIPYAYVMNWVVPKRTDDLLTFYTSRDEAGRPIVNNGMPRTATKIQMTVNGKKAVVDLPKGTSNYLPGMAYWYLLYWDGSALTLTGIKVLPFRVVEDILCFSLDDAELSLGGVGYAKDMDGKVPERPIKVSIPQTSEEPTRPQDGDDNTSTGSIDWRYHKKEKQATNSQR